MSDSGSELADWVGVPYPPYSQHHLSEFLRITFHQANNVRPDTLAREYLWELGTS